jgi:DNA-binding NarL/FixJ family response regulator
LERVNARTSSVAARICEASENRGGCGTARVNGGKQSASGHLTASEKKVLALISLAKSNKEIAVSLCISPATVKRHVENLLRKLELRNRVEAAIYGLMLAGCPGGINSECPLALWHKERIISDPNWAD